jgi:hypothetical protein
MAIVSHRPTRAATLPVCAAHPHPRRDGALDPEANLAVAVLVQALTDLSALDDGLRIDARRWWTEDPEAVDAWCTLAGLPTVVVQRHVAARLSTLDTLVPFPVQLALW